MLQLKREYLGFTLNTATSDAQIKKIGSDKSTSDYAHGINKKKLKFCCLLLLLCFIVLFILLLVGTHKQCLPLQPNKSGACFVQWCSFYFWHRSHAVGGLIDARPMPQLRKWKRYMYRHRCENEDSPSSTLCKCHIASLFICFYLFREIKKWYLPLQPIKSNAHFIQ